MAGTTIFGVRSELADRANSNLYVQFATNMRNIVTDLELLRVSMDLAENWILEFDTDSETINRGTATEDPIDLADGAGETIDTGITSAALTDICLGGLGVDLQDVVATHTVDATASGQTRLQNENAGANIDLASSTLTHIAIPVAASMFTGAITAAVLTATALDTAADLIASSITLL